MAHAQRNFFELHAKNKSTLAEQALRYIQLLYEIESEVAIWAGFTTPNTARKSCTGDEYAARQVDCLA